MLFPGKKNKGIARFVPEFPLLKQQQKKKLCNFILNFMYFKNCNFEICQKQIMSVLNLLTIKFLVGSLKLANYVSIMPCG